MKNKKYKFGFLGQSGSGKTTFFTALSMPHVGTDQGSVSLLPEDYSIKGRKRKIAKEISRGHASITTAAKQLRKGMSPPPTPPNDDVLRLEFTVSAPGSSPWHTDLFDYAGEKVNPKVFSLHKIVRMLEEVDALFVFAPCPTNQNANLPKDMHDLAQVFSAIQQENKKRHLHRVDIPIVLLVNKWDQAADLSQYTHDKYDKHCNALEKFISRRPEYLNLCTIVKAVVGEDNFFSAPVSALGMSKSDRNDPNGDKVVPIDIDPLKSLGLIEPLAWACRRCDELVAERALRQATEVREQHIAFRWFRLLSPKKAHKNLKIAQACVGETAPNYQQLRSESRRMLGTVFVRSLQTIGFLFAVTLLSEAGIDQREARARLQIFKQTNATFFN